MKASTALLLIPFFCLINFFSTNIYADDLVCTPVLLAPVAGEVMDNGCDAESNPITWNFDWADCTGATRYHLYVKKATAAVPVVDNQTITASEFTYESFGHIQTLVLSDWRWRVRAYVGGTWQDWTPERSFDVEALNSDCGACPSALNTPDNGDVLDNGCNTQSNPTTWYFDWNECSGATQYHLYIKHFGAVNPVLDLNTITDSEYTYESFGYVNNANLTDWRWKIRANVGGAWGAWSEERSFDLEPLNTDCNWLLSDSLELVKLYNATNGPNWTNSWNLTQPVSTWYGVTLLSNEGVSEIDLSANGLTGTLPYLQISELERFIITNNSVAGSVPNFNFPKLQYLGLSLNELSGSLPNFNFPNLTAMFLNVNQFSGVLPNFNMPSLFTLSISGNNFSGDLPDFSLMSNLQYFHANDNNFTGNMPAIPSPQLKYIELANSNLSGNLPDFVSTPQLIVINFANNNLSGNIPKLIGLSNLRYLYLNGNKLTGNIPFIGETNLEIAHFHENKLNDIIPEGIGATGAPLLEYYVHRNYFSHNDISANFGTNTDLANFQFTPQYYTDYQYHTIQAEDDLTLSPYPSIPYPKPNVIWQKDDEFITPNYATYDTTYSITNADTTNAGTYHFEFIDYTLLPDVTFISDPIEVYVEGYDLSGEPIITNQFILDISFDADPEFSLEVYELLYEYGGFVADSCNCNRDLLLWEVPEEVNVHELLVEINTKKTGSTVEEDADVDGGFNRKLLTPTNVFSEQTWDWTRFFAPAGSYPHPVDIYLIDSGLDTTNWNYAPFTIPNPPHDSCYAPGFLGYNFTDATINNHIADGEGHGTYGARLITQDVPAHVDMSIVPLKAFDSAGKGTLFDLICATYHAVDHDADIINISAGYKGDKSSVFENSIALAEQKGIFVVSAVGNDTLEFKAATKALQYPATFCESYDNVISTTAVNQDNQLADFANFGAAYTNVAAPGVDIRGHWLGGTEITDSGTSVAAYLLTRALALEMAQDTMRSYTQIWSDFDVNHLVFEPSLIGKTSTGKRLDIDLMSDMIYGDLRVILEGAFDPATGYMRTDLNERGLLPGQTPESPLYTPTPPGQPYDFAPFNYTGSEALPDDMSDYPAEVVDWILVHFREEIAPATTIKTMAAWLLRDGRVQFLEPIFEADETMPDSVYVLIEHRNHMGILSPEKVAISENFIAWDFMSADSYSTSTSVGQKEYPNRWVMLAGDGNQAFDAPGYDIKGDDKTIWTEGNGVFGAYQSADYNLNGDTNGDDKSYWGENNGFNSIVPR